MFNFYINFKEDTGKPWKITNEKDESTPYMEIDKDTYLSFLNLQKRLRDYIVVPSSKQGTAYELKFVHNDLDDFDIEKSIHKIPKDVQPEINSVILKQNLTKGTWGVSLTPSLKETLSSTSYYYGKGHDIYVTYKDDPNILLDTITIDFTPILTNGSYEISNCNKQVAQNPEVSVYCGKVFENYLHLTEYE